MMTSFTRIQVELPEHQLALLTPVATAVSALHSTQYDWVLRMRRAIAQQQHVRPSAAVASAIVPGVAHSMAKLRRRAAHSGSQHAINVAGHALGTARCVRLLRGVKLLTLMALQPKLLRLVSMLVRSAGQGRPLDARTVARRATTQK